MGGEPHIWNRFRYEQKIAPLRTNNSCKRLNCNILLCSYHPICSFTLSSLEVIVTIKYGHLAQQKLRRLAQQQLISKATCISLLEGYGEMCSSGGTSVVARAHLKNEVFPSLLLLVKFAWAQIHFVWTMMSQSHYECSVCDDDSEVMVVFVCCGRSIA